MTTVMGEKRSTPRSASCELIYNNSINNDIFQLVFVWSGPVPKAGQFFMIKPKRSAVFLGRPISAANWQPAATDQDYIRRKARGKATKYQRYLTGKFLESNTVTFLIARRGKGTLELDAMRSGDEAELIGPLGNAWEDFLPPVKEINKNPIALVSGGIGFAPLHALLHAETGHKFILHAGFKKGFKRTEEKISLLGSALLGVEKYLIASEDGKENNKGRITDFLEPEKYAAVCACGPEPMLKAVIEKCKAVQGTAAAVPCFVSLERRMACGVGACLGCAVQTVNGNRRCCADGPIFNAEEIVFDE